MSKKKKNTEDARESLQNIIIPTDRLRSIFYKEKDKHVFPYGWLFGIALTLFVCWIQTEKYISFLSFNSDQIKTSVIIVCIFVLILGSFMFFRALFLKDKSIYPNVDWDNILEKIENNAANKIEKNLILLFVKYEKNGPIFLVQKKSSWNDSYFFPYVKDSYGDQLLTDMKAVRESIHSTLGFPEHLSIRYHHIAKGDFKSIKYNSEKIPQHFQFRFALITSKFPFLTNYIYKHLENEEIPYEWKNLEQLLKDSPSFLNNRDVIEQVKLLKGEIKSAYDRHIGNQSSKVIWNYDKRCNAGCSFCAYGDSGASVKLSEEENKRIIKSLSGLKITDLDIAVGNLAEKDELVNVIKETKRNLPDTKLSLTATSAVIRKILADKKNVITNKTVDCVDISIDFFRPTTEQSSLRKTNYNEENLKLVEELHKKDIKVRVQCVISEKTTSKSLKDLITKLKSIGIDDILLLRMMPVGKLAKDRYPKELLDKKKYTDLLDSIKNIKGVRLHCSLNGLLDSNSTKEYACDMGCKKLGISMNGDVFSCPWAEHLKDPDNPFLLGNILAFPSLDSFISTNEEYKTVIRRKNDNQPHCKIFAHIYGDDPYGNHDELYK